jgi:alpha,alpha-trehalase
MFPQMIDLLLSSNFCENKDFVLGKALDAAIIEYEWFMKNKSVEIIYENAIIILNQYRVLTDNPRYESYKEDLDQYKKLLQKTENPDKNILYSNLSSAAESGHDFSTRFLEDDVNLYSLNILDIIPVDLNALLFKNELIISNLLEMKGDKRFEDFRKAASIREININKVLWNKEKNVWNDYNLKTKKFTDKRFYFSNIMPLLYGVKPQICANTILNTYADVLFGFKGGVPVSEKQDTNHQWDYPNVWAPHQSMLVDYLVLNNYRPLACHVARSFVENGLAGFKTKKVFYEKYSCNNLGMTGDGGEYVPQVGFGWTNGVLIDFILEFKDDFDSDYKFENSLENVKKYLKSLIQI